MASKGNALDLASEMAKQVIFNANSSLPLTAEENGVLLERYACIREAILKSGFAIEGNDAWNFSNSFDFIDFGGTLCRQLLELSVTWNASPFCVAKAILFLPKLLEATIAKVQLEPGGSEVIRNKQAMANIEIFKMRQQHKLFDFDD